MFIMEYNLNHNADNIIKTLESLNRLEGKIDYDSSKETFQNLSYLSSIAGWDTSGNHLPLHEGLAILQNQIEILSEKALLADSDDLYYVSKKIDKMFDLILKANKTLQEKILPSYKKGEIEDTQAVVIRLQINALAKTLANIFGKTLNPLLIKSASHLPPSFKGLPNEIWKEIFLEGNIKDIRKIDKAWNKVANDLMSTKKMIFEEFCFNPSHWNKFCGADTVSPDEIAKAYALLPDNINEILKSDCPAFPDKKIIDTHMLVWIPETINGKPVTTQNFGLLLKNKINYDYLGRLNIQEPLKSGWVLMTTDVVPGSRNQYYTNQKILVENLNKNGQTGYRIPKTAEAIICIAAEYLRSKKLLFGRETYTHCQEMDGYGYQVTLGNFSPWNPPCLQSNCDIWIARFGGEPIGVAALREL